MSPEYFDPIRPSHEAFGQSGFSGGLGMGYYDPLARPTFGSGGLGSGGLSGLGGTSSGGLSTIELSSPSSDRRKQAVYDSEPPPQPNGSGGFGNPAIIGGRYNTTIPASARTVLRAGSRFGSYTLASSEAGIPSPQALANLSANHQQGGITGTTATTAAPTAQPIPPSSKTKGKSNEKPGQAAASAAGAATTAPQLPLLAISPAMAESVFGMSNSTAQNSTNENAIPEQIAIEQFTLALDQPVENCAITPYISLRCNGTVMLAKPLTAKQLEKETKESKEGKDPKEALRPDKLVDIVWSRGRKRICAIPECGKIATLQCLTSVKAGIPMESTMFCSPQCLEASFKAKRQALTTAVLERQLPCGISPTGSTDADYVAFKCLEDSAGEASLIPNSIPHPHPEGSQAKGGKQGNASQTTNQLLKRKGAAPLRASSVGSNAALVPYSGEWFADEDLHSQMHDELLHRLGNTGAALASANSPVVALAMKRYEGIACRYPAPLPDIFTPVHWGWNYTPTSADVGCAIRVDVSPVVVLPKGFTDQDALAAWSDPKLKRWTRLEMVTTIPLPPPRPPRPLISTPVPAQGAPQGANLAFKVFNYNILSPQYTNSQMYPYCPPYALAWSYRYQLIMREIAACNPDIICLQEVLQSCYNDQMEAAFAARGYHGVFRSKQRDADDVDGCAILFKKSKFTLIETKLIDFNQLAQHRSLSLVAQRRIARGNIGLALVLEVNPAGFANGSSNITSATASASGVTTSTTKAAAGSGKDKPPRRFCVANTHIFWDPEYADVKLWQTWQLCRELDDIVKSGRPDEIPLVLCGDFNSVPTSSVYKLLTTQHVPRTHQIFKNDRNGVLPPPHNLNHKLVLSSAYATALSEEPPYTNYAGDFRGVLEYIMYTHKTLMCTAVLGTDPESVYKEYTALPSPHFPSDHISLLAHFDFVDR